MSRLNPLLKQLLSIAARAERSIDDQAEPAAPSYVVARVLRESRSAVPVTFASLLEFMVQRTAGICAGIGAVILTVELSAKGALIGIPQNIFAHAGTLFRVFFP